MISRILLLAISAEETRKQMFAESGFEVTELSFVAMAECQSLF
jgi:hypothetical protein